MLRSGTAASALLLAGCLSATPTTADGPAASASMASTADRRDLIPAHQESSHWYRDASARVTEALGDTAGRAKNVVFFLGDGMGMSTVTAARIFAGQQAGGSGEEHRLSFEAFPVTGLARTYNVDAQTPDSAGTMSAIMTGVKTNIGLFGVDETVIQGDCASSRGRELRTLLDIAELAGRRTGVISTARLTHATPGATYARVASRDWEDDSDLPEGAEKNGCTDIATQLVNHRGYLQAQYGPDASDGIEVAMGGGRRHFLPADRGGRRGDGADLIEGWQQLYPQGRYVSNADELLSATTTPLLGLFANSHMDYLRQRSAPDNTQPGLVAMTEKALELLQQDNDQGFLLVVEAGRIDHAHHAGNAANALSETVELSDAVAAVMQRVNPDDTLVIVTADHSHVFTMAGYPRRGNPILGKVVPPGGDTPALAADGQPYTTLGYMNGRGYRDYGDEPNADTTYREAPTAGRQDLSETDTTAAGFHQEVLVPLSSETHGGEDVPIYATGPGAMAVMGSIEQNQLFHAMLQATGWEAAARARLTALGTEN